MIIMTPQQASSLHVMFKLCKKQQTLQKQEVLDGSRTMAKAYGLSVEHTEDVNV